MKPGPVDFLFDDPATKPASTTSGRYTVLNDDGDLFTVEGFREMVEIGTLIDYDGFGNPSNGTHIDPSRCIYPSEVDEIPSDATHIVWYNR